MAVSGLHTQSFTGTVYFTKNTVYRIQFIFHDYEAIFMSFLTLFHCRSVLFDRLTYLTIEEITIGHSFDF